MVALPETFSPNDVPEDERSFELIPPDNYRVQVIESKIQDTKSGQMIVLTMEIVDGQYANRRLWENLNIRNDSPVAQQIAQTALKYLCDQIGIIQLRDTEELHFKPLTIKVGIQQPTQKDKDAGYDQPKNTVRFNVGASPGSGTGGIRPQGAPTQAPQQGRPPQRSAQAQPAKGAAKPWNQPKQAARQEADDDGLAESFK
jgi:hypothetical protein